MGRFSLPTETATFKHLELWSFAQPGNKYTTTDAQPAVVLRVPTAAVKGNAKYYAGFQIAENAADAAAKFYTTSLQVEVIARRFGSTAAWKRSLNQPNFTAASNIKALTAATTPRTGAPTAAEIRTDTTAAAANAAAPAGQWTNSMVTDAIPGQVVGFTLPN